MADVLKQEGEEVLYLADLLKSNPDGCRKYIETQVEIVRQKIGKFDKKVHGIILDVFEHLMEFPVNGILQGLESAKSFSKLPYGTKFQVYKELKTLMPQTSIYFIQDPVIPTPAGLIKAKMAMRIRKQEPDIVELALGEENYVHRLRNHTEGGDVTMCSYAHGGDTLYIRGMMLFGINAQSGAGIGQESKTLAEKANVGSLVRLYAPDVFDPSKRYANENVMHADTIEMPISDSELLGNKRMLEQTAVLEGTNPIVNAYEWAIKNFKRIVMVPDSEQLKWGANVFPMGNRRILSSKDLPQTNRNLREAGFEVFELPSRTLTSGYGSFHCMIAYLR